MLKQAMRRFLLVLPLVVAITSAQDQGPTRVPAIYPRDAGWVRRLIATKPTKLILAPGLIDSPLYVYEEPDPRAPTHGIKLCWLRLPKSRTAFAVTEVRRSGASNEIYESIKSVRDIVVMNGGFFAFGSKNDFVPIGLVVASGKRTSEFKNWGIGGFVMQISGVPRIVPISQYHNLTGVEQAIQSKPMLIENSRIGIKSDPNPPFNRSAVAIDRNGDVIIAGAFSENGAAVSLIEFSLFLALPRSAGGPEAQYALNLDGGPDAHMYFPGAKLHLGYGGQNYVPNAIHFYVK